MDFPLIAISFVQGVGELLPISSSLNLFFFQHLFSWNFFNFPFKIALHAGSLIALLCFFRREIFDIFMALFTKKKSLNETYFFHLITASLPVVFFGYFSRDYVKEFNNSGAMVLFCVFFGVLLFVMDKISPAIRSKRGFVTSPIKAFIIGIFQALAIFPGVSRLGVCLTACRMLTMDRKSSIFFSLFLAIPAIAGSLFLELFKNFETGETLFTAYAVTGMLITAAFSFFAIFPCIRFMEKKGFFFIMIYRGILGLLVWKLDFILDLLK